MAMSQAFGRAYADTLHLLPPLPLLLLLVCWHAAPAATTASTPRQTQRGRDDYRGGARVQPGDSDRGLPAADDVVVNRGVGVVHLVGLGASRGVEKEEGRAPRRQPPWAGWLALILVAGLRLPA